MLLTYVTVSGPISLSAISSTLLNHLFGSSPSALACWRNLAILFGPALYEAKASNPLLMRSSPGSLKYWSIMKRMYLMPAWILASTLSTSAMLIGLPAAVLGLICITPTAPAALLADWSKRDSW